VNRAYVRARSLILGFLIPVTLLCSTARGDRPPGNVQIGVLSPGNIASETGLRDGLSELGYVEGKNLSIEWRRYASSQDALRAAAEELVRSRVDLIMAASTQAARAALSVTSTIPVVFISADPVASGLVGSLAHPGANATGVSGQASELMAKRLQLLRQVAPASRHVTLLMNPAAPIHTAFLREAQVAGRALHMEIMPLSARTADELDAALHALQHHVGHAFIVTSDALFIVNSGKIAEAVRKARLPLVVPTRDYRADGVLMSYGSNLNWMTHRAAVYIDKILRGARPGDLPIEQSPKLELIIDLRVARELGLKVPEQVLLRADEVLR
jgi:putative ABC transport system substrate-binding protein